MAIFNSELLVYQSVCGVCFPRISLVYFICAMVKLHGMYRVWAPIMNGIPNKLALMD